MHLIAVGLNHRTAPVEVREKVSFGAEQLAPILASLRGTPALVEGLVLSTCNRTEVYGAGPDYHPAVDAATRLIAEAGGLTPAGLKPYLYTHRDDAAVRHLFRVACGLDSMILGESQVLGQVRSAYQQAQAERTVGKLLHGLLAQALQVGKRAQTETRIGQHAVSVSYAAVELARRVFDGFAGRTVLMIGAGKMSELTARHLRDAGADRVVVLNRTRARAEEMAAPFDGLAAGLDELPGWLERADLVISSTGAAGLVVTRELLAEAMGRRRGRPIFIVDIAVPRDVEPGARELDGVFLYDIDDLENAVQANLRERQREARKVEAIVSEEIERYRTWRAALDVVPVIRSLRDKAELIQRAELDKAFARLPDLSLRDRQVIEALASAIVNKLLNDPTLRLKEAAGGEHGALYAQAVSHLFNLSRGAGD